MKTIKCDRCGKEIPYVPPYMNGTLYHRLQKK